MPLMSTLGAASMTSVGHFRGVGVSVSNFVVNGGASINLRDMAIAGGWDGSSRVTFTVTGNVGAINTATPAITVNGSFPGGVDLTIESNVYVCGAGGSGMVYRGSPGGTALSVSSPINITNNGIIGGGGGGGSANSHGYGMGGGGAGIPAGPGNASGSLTLGGNGVSSIGGLPGSAGSGGTSGAGGGLGGSGGSTNGYYDTGHTDPSIGDPDPSGTSGASGGGAGGLCTVGYQYITWIVPGTRYGGLN